MLTDYAHYPLPLLVKVWVAGCAAAANGNSIQYTITATINGNLSVPSSILTRLTRFWLSKTEPITFGECNTQRDCQSSSTRAHPTPGSRVQLSANGDQSRFKYCQITVSAVSRVQSPLYPTHFFGCNHAQNDGFSGRCTECLASCDCGLRQYCSTDPGTCTIGSTSFVCDNTVRESASR